MHPLRRTALACILLWAGARPAGAADVPSPEAHLGFRPGADFHLATWPAVVDYFRKLDAASDRVAVRELGKTTEGRPFIVAAVSARDTIADLAKYRALQRRLADPRVKAADDADPVAASKTVVVITCSIHSTETASTHMAMELAYDLATRDDPATREVLDSTILLLVPSVNPDGVDIVANWYERTKGHPWEGGGLPRLYHKYAGHDTNRDWFMLNLKETQLLSRMLYTEWFPTILYDVHQMGSRGPAVRPAVLRPDQPEPRREGQPGDLPDRGAHGHRPRRGGQARCADQRDVRQLVERRQPDHPATAQHRRRADRGRERPDGQPDLPVEGEPARRLAGVQGPRAGGQLRRPLAGGLVAIARRRRLRADLRPVGAHAGGAVQGAVPVQPAADGPRRGRARRARAAVRLDRPPRPARPGDGRRDGPHPARHRHRGPRRDVAVRGRRDDLPGGHLDLARLAAVPGAPEGHDGAPGVPLAVHRRGPGRGPLRRRRLDPAAPDGRPRDRRGPALRGRVRAHRPGRADPGPHRRAPRRLAFHDRQPGERRLHRPERAARGGRRGACGIEPATRRARRALVPGQCGIARGARKGPARGLDRRRRAARDGGGAGPHPSSPLGPVQAPPHRRLPAVGPEHGRGVDPPRPGEVPLPVRHAPQRRGPRRRPEGEVRHAPDPVDLAAGAPHRVRPERDRAGVRRRPRPGGDGGAAGIHPGGGDARLPRRLVPVRHRGAEPAGRRHAEGAQDVGVLRAGLDPPRRRGAAAPARPSRCLRP